VLTVLEKSGSSKPAFLAKALNNHGVLCSLVGRLAEAESHLKKALAVAEKALGPDHPSMAGILSNYAAVLRQMRRKTEARKLEKRAKAIAETNSHGHLIGYTVDASDLRKGARK
jgi:tetratricopeptide (TPR) repeat protein